MIGYRKLALIGGTVLVAAVLCAGGKIDGGQFTAIALAGITAYGAGNAVEHFTGKAGA